MTLNIIPSTYIRPYPISDAISFARESHAGHARKYTGENYIEHLAAVANLLLDAGMDDEVVAAGVLHDVLEDCWPKVTYDVLEGRFGKRVADLVLEVTNKSRPSDGNRAVRKAIDREYLRKASPDAQSIKYADLINNAESITKHEFARVFLKEMGALLEVMVDGNQALREAAWKMWEKSTLELRGLAA